MEDQIYETGLLNPIDLRKFTQFLDKEIGTEYEKNRESAFTSYIMVFDLTHGEVKKIRKFENSLGEA